MQRCVCCAGSGVGAGRRGAVLGGGHGLPVPHAADGQGARQGLHLQASQPFWLSLGLLQWLHCAMSSMPGVLHAQALTSVSFARVRC